MDDDVVEWGQTVHAALASAQTKVLQAVARQRLSVAMREQLVLELNWLLKRVQDAPTN